MQIQRHRRNYEHVHGVDVACVNAKERPLPLRVRSSPPVVILGNGGLPNIDTEFEQFPLESGRVRQLAVNARLLDKVPDFPRHLRPSCRRSGFPEPERPRYPSIPADHPLRLDERQSIQSPGRRAIHPHKEQPVGSVKILLTVAYRIAIERNL